jgi:glycosyltransferase involved in cell wall biosynthesis
MSTLSLVVITKNEEANLARCLDSVRFADELIVVDSHSADRTVEIAEKCGARVLTVDWKGYGPAKQTGVDAAGCDWVLSLDADEAVSEELATEIKTVLTSSNAEAGYAIPRRTNFLGRWIYHCGWYPDRVIRLFRRDKGRFDEAVVHEKVIVDGSVGLLSAEILHYCYPDLDSYFRKFNWYTSVGAEEAYKNGKRAGLFHLVVKPPASFLAHYVLRQGFRDGIEGLLVSALSAGAVLVKYAKLRDLQRNRTNR